MYLGIPVHGLVKSRKQSLSQPGSKDSETRIGHRNAAEVFLLIHTIISTIQSIYTGMQNDKETMYCKPVQQVIKSLRPHESP